MKYLPTVNLWNRAVHAAVRNGQLRLQCGQWVRCGEGHKSRWVGMTKGGTMLVAHWQGSGKRTVERFNVLRGVRR